METTMNNLHPDTSVPVDETPQPNAAARPARRAGRPGDDMVRWAEFRLAMWMGGFALAVIISTQGFLFSAILGLKDDIGGLRADMHAQIGVLRGEMHEQIGVLRGEMHEQIGMLRGEMQKQNGMLRADMQELRVEMQTQFGEQRERTVRIETHLGMDAGSVEKAN